jgi:ABC-type glycerol-3-phosphate transport system substrate-binding protein
MLMASSRRIVHPASEAAHGGTPMLRIAAAILAIAIAAASALSPADSATTETTIIYVNAAATGANDGTSWKDAFNTLQDALVS